MTTPGQSVAQVARLWMAFGGVRCLGRRRAQSTSKKTPLFLSTPEQVCWKYSGSGNKSDPCMGVVFFFPPGSLNSNSGGVNAPVNSHCPG